MNLFFSDKPGSHERHLRRKVNNPLFGDLVITQDAIQQARETDEKELESFMDDFHELARDASQLDASVDGEVLIELKQRLEKNYETSCYVMGNMVEIKQALSRLIDSIMNSLLHASQQDEHAHQKLVDEQAARSVHFELLDNALVADLMRVESPVQSEELVPSILSEVDKGIAAVAQIFTEDQLDFICTHANNMLEGVESDHSKITNARKMLGLLESERDRLKDQSQPQAGNRGLAS